MLLARYVFQKGLETRTFRHIGYFIAKNRNYRDLVRFCPDFRIAIVLFSSLLNQYLLNN